MKLQLSGDDQNLQLPSSLGPFKVPSERGSPFPKKFRKLSLIPEYVPNHQDTQRRSKTVERDQMTVGGMLHEPKTP